MISSKVEIPLSRVRVQRGEEIIVEENENIEKKLLVNAEKLCKSYEKTLKNSEKYENSKKNMKNYENSEKLKNWKKKL